MPSGRDSVVLVFGRAGKDNSYELTPGVFDGVRVCGVNVHGDPDLKVNFNDIPALKSAVAQLGADVIGAFFDSWTTKFIGVDGRLPGNFEELARGHNELFACVAELLMPGGFLLYQFPHASFRHQFPFVEESIYRICALLAFEHCTEHVDVLHPFIQSPWRNTMLAMVSPKPLQRVFSAGEWQELMAGGPRP